MMPLVGMIVGCIAAAGAAAAIATNRGLPDLVAPIFGGMIGPLVAAIGTWLLVTRTFRRNPAALTNLMVTAFAVKAVFFGVYCIVMVKVAALAVRPFGLSFASFFIALYAVEAALFARLFRQAQETR